MLPASHRRDPGSKPGHLFIIYGRQSGTLTGFSPGIEIVYPTLCSLTTDNVAKYRNRIIILKLMVHIFTTVK